MFHVEQNRFFQPMKVEDVKKIIRDVPDFPTKGILFKDITTAFLDPVCLNFMIDYYVDLYKDKGITKVVGIESRGFFLGPSIASRLGAGFVPVRKPGKLPAETVKKSYDLEYGSDTVEVHKDALNKNDVVLLHDDLLATGGTMQAAISLMKKCHVSKMYVSFIIELEFLKGIEKFEKEVPIHSMIKY